MARDTSMLRDVLFDELDDLRKGSADPKRSMAVAKLSQQIISTAKVEMDFHKLAMKAREAGQELVLGSMDLGSHAVSADKSADRKAIEQGAAQSPN